MTLMKFVDINVPATCALEVNTEYACVMVHSYFSCSLHCEHCT